MQVTAKQVKQSMIDNNIRKINIRKCSMCGYMLNYFRSTPNDILLLDTGCNCVTYHNVTPVEYDELAAWINNQNEEYKIKLAKEVGINLKEEEVKDEN